MAIKDLFNGFFTIEEEEDTFVEEQEARQQQRKASETAQASKPAHERPRAIQSVPKKQPTRIKTPKNERLHQVPQQSNNQGQGNVVSMNQSQEVEQNGSSKMCLFEPRVFSDTQDIADELKNRRATLVNLQRIDQVSAKRIIDFLSGTVYAIGGDIQRVGADIFLCTPDNVEVAGSITDQIESMETQYE
ncbi:MULTISPECIES: cell division protein SepF [unclassified Staphylococcus]|uniref:cell division protein SepF n=1 Tax=unclassified Staphylococcus TaxID=91994 RepID=UPI0021D091B3|nr:MULTISPECIES: cell division protein SepF [unclassified Staphylococcus]UXR77604.1 cell division protein SepF [Staphylococcus sp. IVB6227]UXR83254.1 cell division protein SepF [Staphylococcus sp. IVB6214]